MKQAFKEIGKSYATAAAEIGCSKPMLVAVVNHGRWPKKGADKLREKLKQYFETNGADIPAGLRNEPEAAPAHPNESEDKEMLLRKATLTQAAHFTVCSIWRPWRRVRTATLRALSCSFGVSK